MIGGKVTVINEVEGELAALAAELKNPAALHKDVGRRVVRDLKRHFVAKGAKPNKRGGKRTHYWVDMAESVQEAQIVSGGIEILISHYGLGLHVYGGTVVPKEKEELTIPLHALAHGRTAAVFRDETGKKLFRPKGKKILMADMGSGAVAIYALTKSAAIPRDPTALPPREDIISTILSGARAHYARRKKIGG